MLRKLLFSLLCVSLIVAGYLHNVETARPGSGGSRFDRLTDADRLVLSARFEKEVWPLLTRNGKDGCVGCHDAKNRTALRFSGKADQDFVKILRDGFLLVNDPGSMLHVVATKNPKQKMPPGNRPGWSEQEIKILRQFVTDLAGKQQK